MIMMKMMMLMIHQSLVQLWPLRILHHFRQVVYCFSISRKNVPIFQFSVFHNFQNPEDGGHTIDQEKDIYAIPSIGKDEVYFLALVDILTTYGMKKQAAKVAKTIYKGTDNVQGISTIEPEQYANRFLEFISNAME